MRHCLERTGILNRAGQASDNSKRQSFIEQVQLDIMATQTQQDGNATDLQILNVLAKYFTGIPTTDGSKLSDLPDTLTPDTSKGYGPYNPVTIGKTEVLGRIAPSGGGSTPSAGVSGIKDASGNAITPSSLSVGDAIFIGNEKFEVINAEGSTIVAMAWNNITLPADPEAEHPVQTDSSSSPLKQFSSTNYWAEEITDYTVYPPINMNDSRNYIQPYITAYHKTLTVDNGASGIETRIPLNSDVSSLTNAQRQPGTARYFWLGSARGSDDVRFVSSSRRSRLQLLLRRQRRSPCNRIL